MQRRDLFKLGAASAAGALPLGAAYSASAATPTAPLKLKITDITQIRLRVDKDLGTMDQESASPPLRYRTSVGGGSIVQIHTNEGIVGMGPGIDPSMLPGMKALLVGKDPFDITDHALRLYNPGRRGGASVEIALWDIIGKACNQPLYKLWDGAVSGVQTSAGHNKVMPYASQWTVGTPQNRVEMIQRLKADGWGAIKMRLGLATLKEDVALIEAARKAVGDDFIITCDANKAGPYASSWPAYPWDFNRAVDTARALRPYNLTWLEEPLPRYDYDQLAQLNHMAAVPIAGGENNSGINEFLTVMQKGCFEYVQPEVLGLGPTMLRSIAVLAAAFDIKIVPHAGSRGICQYALLHLIASWPHAPLMEIIHEPPGTPWETAMAPFENPPTLDKQGYLTAPEGPGLGVTIKPEYILKG